MPRSKRRRLEEWIGFALVAGAGLGFAALYLRARGQISDEDAEEAEPPNIANTERRVNDFPPANEGDLVPVQGSYQLIASAAAAYGRMLSAARGDGIQAPLLELKSAYRSDARQRELWTAGLARYRARLAESLKRDPTEPEVIAETSKYVARPGRSEHRTGRAVDLNLGLPNDSRQVKAQRETVAWKWMHDNAGRFGWYPYLQEPWHWSFNPARPAVA